MPVSVGKKVKVSITFDWSCLPWYWEETSFEEDSPEVQDVEVFVYVDGPEWIKKAVESFLSNELFVEGLKSFKKGDNECQEDFGKNVVDPIVDRLLEVLPDSVDLVKRNKSEDAEKEYDLYPDCDNECGISVALMAYPA